MSRFIRLGPHLAVHRGAVNVGVVVDGDRALLIDCGDASVLETLQELGGLKPELILVTHHHRDQVSAAGALVSSGAALAVPRGERNCFEEVDRYWQSPKSRWHLYDFHPHHVMLAESVRVERELSDGDTFRWGEAVVRVLSTPGHTEHSLAFEVEVDGQRAVFCGDAVYGDGQLWELYSLQKGTQTRDYHGFLGALPQLTASLDRLSAVQPDMLVPAHGPVVREPLASLETLSRRLAQCYDCYVGISALRHYFPALFEDHVALTEHLPIRAGKEVPACLTHVGTSWILKSDDGSAFVMDCGNRRVLERLRALQDEGALGPIEGLWVTHYHDDHVDAIPEFQRRFDCECVTTDSVAQVITHPLSWRLPCVSPSVARVDRVAHHGESWQWQEYKLTAYEFPGQTLYHSGLLVEGHGLRLFFVGDSFTPAGIDDYCAQNRNWLGEGVGFQACLDLLEETRPTDLFNCHVDFGFDFTPAQIALMRRNLHQRERLFGELLAWDHPNYGMDDSWVRCHPYEQSVEPGTELTFEVAVTNHSPEAQSAQCRPVLPSAWRAGDLVSSSNRWSAATIPPKTEGSLAVRAPVPNGVDPGRYVIPVDLRYGNRELSQVTEAIVVV